MKTLYRKEKITMFIKDYYFGYSKWITILRLLGGPLLMIIGLYFYTTGIDKFSIAYSGICILYGAYMIVKPIVWVLSRFDSYKTETLDIKIDYNCITVRDNNNEFKIGFETFIKMIDNKDYFTFIISKSQRLRLPKRLIEVDEQKIILNKIR